MKKLILAALLIIFALAATSAVAKDWAKVRIGVEGAYPPFSYVTPEYCFYRLAGSTAFRCSDVRSGTGTACVMRKAFSS